MFRFANSEYLYLLFALIPMAAIFGYAMYRRSRNLKKYGNYQILKQFMPGYTTWRYYFKCALFMIALAGAIFVAARPQFGSKLEMVKRKGVEVMIAMDVSNSMLCEDIKPSRLQKSKQMIYKFVDGMENDKLGLIVFAGQAFTQLPMTSDYSAAKMYASNISTGVIPTQGTAIGAAIKMAANGFSSKTNVGKAIIVITDGENHEDDAVEQAKAAYESGIQVHVIGIGKPEGAPIPDGHGSFRKDIDGQTVITKLNEQMAAEIAAAGGGLYVRADNTNNALKYIQSELDKSAKGDVESKVYTDFDEQFQTIAWIVLVIIILEIFIRERKNKFLSKFKLF